MDAATETIPPRLRAVVQRADHPDFFFVNIGAGDGVSNDYIFPFLSEYDWRGLAVEPLPDRFEELARNYARFPNVALERAAVTDRPRAFHFLAAGKEYDRSWTKQVGTFHRDLLVETIGMMRTWEMAGPVPDDLEQAIASTEVPCLSFEALMQKHAVEGIDLLSIDAEGSDYEIFCAIDLRRYRPSIMVIETGNMTAEQRTDFDGRLSRSGYVVLSRLDFLTEAFVTRDLVSPGGSVGRLRAWIGERLRRPRNG